MNITQHFHAYYQDYKVIDINSCEGMEGNLTKKQLKLVLAWAELRKEELLANWRLVMNGEPPFKIEGLSVKPTTGHKKTKTETSMYYSQTKAPQGIS